MANFEPNQRPSQSEPRLGPASSSAPQPVLTVRVEHVDAKAAVAQPPGPPRGEPAPATVPARPAEAREAPRISHPAPSQPIAERVPERVAGMLAYLFGWVGGLVFLFVDRRPFVRYHAAQSIVVFATLTGLLLVLGDFFLATFIPGAGGFFLALRRIVELIWLAAAIMLMLKASSGERFRVPWAAAYADRAARSKE
jgi:uncharacterized membrane protein